MPAPFLSFRVSRSVTCHKSSMMRVWIKSPTQSSDEPFRVKFAQATVESREIDMLSQLRIHFSTLSRKKLLLAPSRNVTPFCDIKIHFDFTERNKAESERHSTNEQERTQPRPSPTSTR